MSETSSEDRATMALLFCATFGIGSMSFGSVFAAEGPLLGSIAVYFLSACNLHASVALNKAMQACPSSVRTFSDLGFYAFGETGRRIIMLAEFGVCFLCPIAFLILGGTSLLPSIFEKEISSTNWILIMSLSVFPVILIPTLRGTASLCYLGGLFAVLADLICIGYSISELPFEPRETQIQLDHSMKSFGMIMFAFGTAILVPPLQRQHSDPSRLNAILSLTLLFITSVYLLIGITSYFQFGCTAPATLLDQLPDGNQWKQLASGLMLLHVIIAFPVLLNPTLFDLERYLLGKDSDLIALQQTVAIRTGAAAAGGGGKGSNKNQLLTKPLVNEATSGLYHHQENPFLYDTLRQRSANEPESQKEAQQKAHEHPPVVVSDHPHTTTFSTSDRIWSGLIRLLVLASQVVLAVMFQSSFSDILSLIGATAITISCMIMPCLCYMKVYPIGDDFKGKSDRFLCYLIIVSSALLGIYCSIVAMGNIAANFSKYELFQAVPHAKEQTFATEGDEYPYCHEGERN